MTIKLPRLLLVLCASITMFSCKKNDGQLSTDPKDRYALDTEKVSEFYAKHPEFKSAESKIAALYKSSSNKMIWYDRDGRIDFAEVLYDKALQIEKEGVPVDLPYKSEYADLFEERDTKKPSAEDDLLVSALYIFYVDKVYAGIPPAQSRQMGWFLPRQKVSYVSYLDTLMNDPSLLKDGKMENFSQYEYLRKALAKYREIEKKGGWPAISASAKKTFKKGDSDPVIAQVKKRLAVTGDLPAEATGDNFDATLEDAIVKYNKRRYMDGKTITPDLISELNVPVAERIRTIVVNMERCRWISADTEKSSEYVAVNIPSYHLTYVKDGKPALESNVVVGKALNKTVVFSGKMSYLVFSPYWNIPKSIVAKEIEPALAKDPGYLEKQNMEKVGSNYRQKPGPTNSLGLVKFMFPNQNNIYLHDSPAKSLFTRNERAFSHGCVRVQKAKELAYMILEDDKKMSKSKIDEYMNSGTEKQYALNRKIPVYIAYFTAMADENGNVSFFEDIYSRDKRLANLLYQ